MREKFIESLDEVIENCGTIEMEFVADNHMLDIAFVPDDIEQDDDGVTIYSGNNTFYVKTNLLKWNDRFGAFTADTPHSAITISM